MTRERIIGRPTLNEIMLATNDVVMTEILPIYKIIKIITYQSADNIWLSKIKYSDGIINTLTDFKIGDYVEVTNLSEDEETNLFNGFKSHIVNIDESCQYPIELRCGYMVYPNEIEKTEEEDSEE